MPFGIKTASKEYQHHQPEALQGVPGLAIVADDLLVCGYVDTMQEAIQNHNHNLTKLLDRCRQKNLLNSTGKKSSYVRLCHILDICCQAGSNQSSSHCKHAEVF